MPDCDQFLRAICDAPEDASPRLIFADWLEEQGDAESRDRAEFIRVQCSVARLDEELADWNEWASLSSQLPALRQREQELLRKYADMWNRPIRERVAACAFSRGFVEHVTIDVPSFLREADNLCALAPIREVRFHSLQYGEQVSRMQQLAAAPALGRLRALDFHDSNLGNAVVAHLLSSPHLTHLTRLNLSRTGLNDYQLRPLATWPRLGQLIHLDLSHNYLTADGLRELMRGSLRLRRLVLEGNPAATGQAARALASMLSDAPQPELLRIVLRMQEEPRRQPSERMVQRLAEEAKAGLPSQVLTRSLDNSWWKVRSAAAHLLGSVRAPATAIVPALVQHLFDGNESVRRGVAGALDRLLPDQPTPLQEAMALLANPVRAPEDNLRVALRSPRWPAAVLASFDELCQRRHLWRQRIAEPDAPPFAIPDPGALRSTAERTEMVQTLAGMAEAIALRHIKPHQHATIIGEAARSKECAWLSARLLELLQRHLDEKEHA